MGKKNFTADADDIFGGYAAEKVAEKPKKQVKKSARAATKEYELYLLAIEKKQLAQLQAWAANRKMEIKDLLGEILEEKLSTVENLPELLDAYQKER